MNAVVRAFEIVQQSYLVNHPHELFTEEQLRFGCGRGLPVIVDYAGVDADHLSEVQQVARHLSYLRDELINYQRVVVKNPQPVQWDKVDEFGVRQALKRPHDFTSKTVTAYTRRKYAKLYRDLKDLIFHPKAIDRTHFSPVNWDNAEQLTKLGFLVSYDKTSGQATVQLGTYQLLV